METFRVQSGNIRNNDKTISVKILILIVTTEIKIITTINLNPKIINLKKN